MNDPVKMWRAYAQEDLDVARHAVSVGWLNSACFHAQQCGEKWLKALLTYYGQPVPRSHDLDYLADLVEPFAKNVGDIREATLVLTEYAVSSRYPSPLEIDVDEAAQAVSYAQQIQEWAEVHLARSAD
ncbi:HEPN domain-containing protein [Sulfobacillus thermosulfidooxidans]|nr:HEPN domain-containing protein [Sulfobacillus thermosulfidooxidans]